MVGAAGTLDDEPVGVEPDVIVLTGCNDPVQLAP